MPYTRTRTGCFTCREDGYKCDEERPTCGRCVRLGKVCKGYGVRLKWRAMWAPCSASGSTATQPPEWPPKPPLKTSAASSDAAPTATVKSRRRRGRRSPVPVPDALPSNLSYLPHDVDRESRQLLHHWAVALAPIVSMAPAPDNRNPFLVHLTPMLTQSPAVRFAMSSMAAGHLATLRGGDTSMEITAARHRLRAVSSLRQSIQSEQPELSLAAILMLQISERLFTADSRVDHLSGAKAVIAQGEASSPSWATSSASQFLLSLCSYHDVLSSVARGASPLLNLRQSFPIEGLPSLRDLTSMLALVGLISKLRRPVYSAVDSAMARAIEQALGEPAGPGPEQALDDISHTTQAYRHAAFIYLYRVWRNQGAPHPTSLYHARHCLFHLAQVPATSSLVSSHIWPLWTAGCESIDAGDREAVSARIDAMFSLRHLPALRRIKADMQEVWAIKDAQRSLMGVDNVDCVKFILANRRREADIA